MDINFNNLQKVIYNGTELDKVYYNNILVFQKCWEGGIITMIFGGNWKMNVPKEGGINSSYTQNIMTYLNSLIPQVAGKGEKTIILFPPAIYCDCIMRKIAGSNIKLGIQMISAYNNGAFTGQISASMAKDIGCEYVLIGTGEERFYMNVDDYQVNQKIKQALANNLKPILFVGENLEEIENGLSEEVLTKQLNIALEGVSDPQNIIFAYEPVWAIGTGKTATIETANNKCSFISSFLKSHYKINNAQICYAGSITPRNSSELLAQPAINGGVIASGASLNSTSFAEMVNNI